MKRATAENDRNAKSSELYAAILKEAIPGVSLVVASHHIFFKRDGVTDELPAADTLIFDHEIARKIWGGAYKEVLAYLSAEPPESRDALLRTLYENRSS